MMLLRQNLDLMIGFLRIHAIGNSEGAFLRRAANHEEVAFQVAEVGRVDWLAAKVAAGLGRSAAAVSEAKVAADGPVPTINLQESKT